MEGEERLQPLADHRRAWRKSNQDPAQAERTSSAASAAEAASMLSDAYTIGDQADSTNIIIERVDFKESR